MADEENTGKTEAELRDRIWELAEDIGFCMLTTWDGKKQLARPMSATVEQESDAIYFLTDNRDGKVTQLENYPDVLITFTKGMKFVTMNGSAKVSNDRAKIKELFTTAAKAWWDSADDPDIRLITMTPDEAEMWDSPNMLVSSALMLTAAVTGTKPKIGDHAKVAV